MFNINYIIIIGAEFMVDSPFGIDYTLPSVGLFCRPGATTVNQCYVYTRPTDVCNYKTNGLVCRGEL